ncbi:MAG: hypothetical protein K2Q20_03595 [Phycisphaerales bacterium]|nr:hypothetical protein [Phycisphaerales bacterium]
MTRSRVRGVTGVRGLLVACGVSLGLLNASALAIPAVLERVPDDAMIAVAIPAPQTLTKNLAALSKAIGTDLPEVSVQDALGMGGFTTGVDATKALAIIIMKPKEQPKLEGKAPGEAEREMVDELDKRALLLLPITSFDEVLKGFDAKAPGDGKAATISLPTGEDGFIKDLGGGYAVVGSSRDLVEAFTGKAGATAMKTRMGKAGDELSDASDIVTIVNIDAVRPLAVEALKQFEVQAKERAEAMGQNPEAQIAAVKWLGEAFIRDTKFVTGGVKLSASGIGMDLVGSFNEGSYVAATVTGGGSSSSLLSKLPAGPYLLAAALDTRSEGARKLFADLYAKSGATADKAVTEANEKLYTQADGQAAVVGFPMGGALAGLLTSTVGFTASKDSAQALKNIRESVTVMNDKTIEGMSYKATYTEASGKPETPAFDSWDMKIAMKDADQAGQMGAQAMQFMFGPQGGPGGYLAKGDGGVYRTYSRNSELMTKAIAAGNGGEALGADALIKDVQAKLPAARVAEIYVGTRSLLDLVLPFAAMAGVPIGADKIPEKLPPVGLSISAAGGAAQMSVFVPAEVAKTGFALAEAFEQMQNNAEGGGGGEAPAEGKKPSGAGQPKF